MAVNNAKDDVKLALDIVPKWLGAVSTPSSHLRPKLFFRKGQALLGLRRWDEAIEAFRQGQELDPQNPDWDKEMNRTRAARDTYLARKAK